MGRLSKSLLVIARLYSCVDLIGELSFMPMPELSNQEAAAIMARTYGVRLPLPGEGMYNSHLC